MNSNLQKLIESYNNFIKRIDFFFEQNLKKYKDEINCKPGCWKCCRNHDLSVCVVEAYNIVKYLRENQTENNIKEQLRYIEDSQDKYCPFLTKHKICFIYPVRPLICRTEGIALAEGNIIQDKDVKVYWCEENFKNITPELNFILNIKSSEEILGTLNYMFVKSHKGLTPSSRFSLLEVIYNYKILLVDL